MPALGKKPGDRIVVLKRVMGDGDLDALIDDKKTGLFRSALRRTRRADIAVESVTLGYLCITTVSGAYTADYFRRATHAISVDDGVREVVFGGATFPIRPRSALHKRISGRLGKNRVDLPVEEHVRVEREGRFHIDTGGVEIKFPYKINSSTVEHYPRRVLGGADPARVEDGFAHSSRDELAAKLADLLRPDLGEGIRDLAEDAAVREVVLTYVPVYAAALSGPRGKTAVMNIDAALSRVRPTS